MGAMPGNRERKDCQTDLEGVRDRARKQTQRGEVLEIVKTDRTFNENQANREENKSVKVRGVQSKKGLQVKKY